MSMTKEFDGYRNAITIAPTVNNCRKEGKIFIASNNYETSHCNLYIDQGDNHLCLCMQPSEAIALRDLLLKAYPVAVEEPEFFVDGDDVYCRLAVRTTKFVGNFASEADAVAYAAHRNAQ